MVQQQVNNVVRHLQKAHGITKKQVTEDQMAIWCHCEGYAGTYTPYPVNIWSLRNKEDNKDKVKQQVNNVFSPPPEGPWHPKRGSDGQPP